MKIEKEEIDKNKNNDEKNISLIEIIIEGHQKMFPLLKDVEQQIQINLKNVIQNIKNKDKLLYELKNMVKRNEINSELNYYFLKNLKDRDIKYEENGETWDYTSNMKKLKETLTEYHYELLDSKKSTNPLTELKLILKAYVKKELEDNNSEINYYKSLYVNKDIRFNFPLVSGIERLRIEYYKKLILEKDISEYCPLIDSYIDVLDKDKDIIEFSLDETKFCPKTYLLMIILNNFNIEKSDLISNFLIKNIVDSKSNQNFEFIKCLENGKYQVETRFEKEIVNKEDYILEGLENDIRSHKYYPLKLILFRNESFKKFKETDGKGFLQELGLYEYFISYLKEFVKSKCFRDLINQNVCYQNIGTLLNNESYLEEMLDEKHFKFLPFYGLDELYGYTDKDLVISFINSIPELVKNIRIKKETDIKNITNICLIFTIAVKFLTSLHEFIMHLTYYYLRFFSGNLLNAKSEKESDDDSEDGGYFFEKKLIGKNRLDYLNINQVITLLDGEACQNNLETFQKIMKNKTIDINSLNKKKFNGFLRILNDEKYKIDFRFFNKNNENIRVFCRGMNGIGIFLRRFGSDTIGGGKKKIEK